jgi:hypothetical protein
LNAFERLCFFNCSHVHLLKCSIFPTIVGKIAPRGFEPLNEKPQSAENKALTENKNPVLDTSLDKILQKHPDLALVVERWPDLPDTIKQAVKALVEIQPKANGHTAGCEGG